MLHLAFCWLGILTAFVQKRIQEKSGKIQEEKLKRKETTYMSASTEFDQE